MKSEGTGVDMESIEVSIPNTRAPEMDSVQSVIVACPDSDTARQPAVRACHIQQGDLEHA